MMIVGKPLLTAERIQKRITVLAEKISYDYQGKDIFVVGLLKGAFMFLSDLVRLIQIPVEVDFMIVSSYVQTESTGDVRIYSDLRSDIKGKDVLIVEDIVDTGVTLHALRERLLYRDPASLKICALLDKKERRQVEVPVDYVGFEIPDKFVVGYGLDYEDKYRNLPYIAIFKEERS
jgi:hypoxanthine phosphoribosyltransferase